jgi:hypothetical protein
VGAVDAAVSIAELSWDAPSSSVHTALRLPPDVAGDPAALVIRLDDSFAHASARRGSSGDSIGDAVDAALAHVLAAAGPRFSSTPVQLDFDAPASQLEQYAAWLGHLRSSSLRGRVVWTTSLVSHVENARYDALFAGLIDGTVVQVFDTGDAFTPATADALVRALSSLRVPFALGLGAFERAHTDHGAWLAMVPKLAVLSGYRGVFVFAAGHDWRALRTELP